MISLTTGFTLSGDWGKLAFGGYAEAAFGAMAIDVTADEGHGYTAAAASGTYVSGEYGSVFPAMNTSTMQTFLTLPTVSGVTVMLSAAIPTTPRWPALATPCPLVMLALLAYAQGSSSATNSDDSQIAAKISAGNATVTVISGASGLHNNSGVGATYAVSDALTIQAYSGKTDHDTDTDFEVTDTGIGLTYTVTPGMKISITSNDYSGKGGNDNGSAADVSGSRNNIALDVSF